ncbi:MAG: orotate phosphoribosyltransferase [Clostridia bacterium]|nr:orotate phosphoribosyltransferase [Clostridia bacterium]
MSRERIVEILKGSDAFLEGHFLLTSGKHSNGYVQCAKVLRHPEYAEEIIGYVIEQIKNLDIDIIVGPAMGGVIVAYEMGRQMKKEAIFTERVDREMKLRRGFEIPKGANVLIAEDVVTTGKSTLEAKKIIESLGGKVMAAACMVDRRSQDQELDFPVYAAIKLDIATYDSESCPICKEGIELVKPGSRKLKV